MPWKQEKDPYKIWISEIILQQTRVEQGLPYYERFINAFPKVAALATADDDAIYKMWQGLGYYSRCKNLIATARYIHEQLDGKFPETYEMILALKGVGPYTAAAIASFAYNLPHAVLDGNVFRVLSRYFGMYTPIDSTLGKKEYAHKAQLLLDKKDAGAYNQAIMDFGALICRPANPQCNICVLRTKCVAYQGNKQDLLPVKVKKITKTKRCFNYVVIKTRKGIVVRKRTAADIWQNLYDFMLLESDLIIPAEKLLSKQPFTAVLEHSKWLVINSSKNFTQTLTHQHITARFVLIEVDTLPHLPAGFQIVSLAQLQTLAFPKIIAAYLTDRNVSLNLNLSKQQELCAV